MIVLIRLYLDQDIPRHCFDDSTFAEFSNPLFGDARHAVHRAEQISRDRSGRITVAVDVHCFDYARSEISGVLQSTVNSDCQSFFRDPALSDFVSTLGTSGSFQCGNGFCCVPIRRFRLGFQKPDDFVQNSINLPASAQQGDEHRHRPASRDSGWVTVGNRGNITSHIVCKFRFEKQPDWSRSHHRTASLAIIVCSQIAPSPRLQS